MDFCGWIYSPKETIFSNLYVPLAKIKNLFHHFYYFLLQTMWRELLSGKKIENESVNLFLFVIVC